MCRFAEVLFNKLTEYEHTGLQYYADGDMNEKVLTNPSHDYEKSTMNLVERLGDPYSHIIEWLRMEIYDLHGLQESIEGVKNLQKKIQTEKGEIQNLKDYVDDLNQEKTSFKKIWMKVTFRSMTADQCMQKIFELESQVDAWEQVLEYVTYYIPMVVFPRFKRDRGTQYLQFLADYAEEHSESAEFNIELWERLAYFTQTREELQNNKLFTADVMEEITE